MDEDAAPMLDDAKKSLVEIEQEQFFLAERIELAEKQMSALQNVINIINNRERLRSGGPFPFLLDSFSHISGAAERISS